jgi:hypothetical protein
MQSVAIVDVLDEVGKGGGGFLEGFKGHRVDELDLEGFHEAFGLGVVVRVAAPAHRSDGAVIVRGSVLEARGVLGSAVGVMDVSRRRMPPGDGGLERGEREAGIDHPSGRIAGRKNWLFAGSKAGGERAAAIYTVIETCKLNGVEPQAYIADVIAKIAGNWPAARWDELMPWNWPPRLPDDRRSRIGNVAIRPVAVMVTVWHLGSAE